MVPRLRLRTMRRTSLTRSSMGLAGGGNERSQSVALTFSRELKSDDSVALFEGSRLTVADLNVNVNGVKNGFPQGKIHELGGVGKNRGSGGGRKCGRR